MNIQQLEHKFGDSTSESITEIVISDDDDEIVVRESTDRSSKRSINENLEKSLDLQDKENIPDNACNSTTELLVISSNGVENNSKTSNKPTEELDEITLFDGITEDLDKSSDVEFDEDFLWEDNVTNISIRGQTPKNSLPKIDSSKITEKTSISSAKPDKKSSNQTGEANSGAKEGEKVNGLNSKVMAVHKDGSDQSKQSSSKPISIVLKVPSKKNKIETTNPKIINKIATQQPDLELKEMSVKSAKEKSLTNVMLGKDNIVKPKNNKRPASPPDNHDSIRNPKIFIGVEQESINNSRETVRNGIAAAGGIKETSEVRRDCTNEEEISIELLDADLEIGRVEEVTSQPSTQKTNGSSQFELNFVRKFQKDFVEMNRNDLEELLIQKCVETIVHQSEYADMRNKIVAQEKQLQKFSNKYQELRKRFIDLQIALHQVIKDLKVKNRNVVAPLKITRSVGVQVSMARKNNEKPHRQSLSGNTTITKRNPSTLGNKTSDFSPGAAERPHSSPVIFKTPTQPVSAKTSAPNSVSSTDEACKDQSNLSNTPISRLLPTTSSSDINNIIELIDDENSEGDVTSRRNVQPLPPLPNSSNSPTNSQWKLIPPSPKIIEIINSEKGIIITWNIEKVTDEHAKIASYQIYTYKETLVGAPSEVWRLVGDVEPLLLPMAVTLTIFEVGHRYHFSVRAFDEHGRYSTFSLPKTW